MKVYLYPLLFFLLLVGRTETVFSQENLTRESSTPSENPELHKRNKEHHEPAGNLYPDHPDVPDVLVDRVEHEADTFQAKFLNMLFLLALLIGFMILASWSLKRLMKTKITNLNTASTIKVLETRYLSPRATLYLVEVQNHTLLMAESPTTVTLLATIPQDTDSGSPLN